MRRDAILTALDLLYITIAKQKTWKRNWHEDVAREVWTWKQLLLHVSPEVAEGIMVERKVNMMDPDFSFRKAIAKDIPGWE
jgi:hypothetical protein